MSRSDETPLDTRVEAVDPWVFWTLTLLGVAIIGFGAFGIWTHRGDGVLDLRLRPWLTWFVGAIVLHDLVIAPIVLLIGRGLRFVRPRLLRGPLQVGLALTALLTLMAFPLLRGYGARAVSPSQLPRDYVSGWLVLLAAVWAGCALWAWWRQHPRTGSPRVRASASEPAGGDHR